MTEKDTTSTLDKVMKNMNEVCGPGTMFLGTGLKKDPPRLPSGAFAVDFATGGGLPIWGTTCYWGPDQAGKSSLCIDTARMVTQICWRCFNSLDRCCCSTKPVEMKTYWGDVEGTLDQDWAIGIGVDPEKWMIGLADYGEQHIDIAESALRADDCGLIVIDSLAALTPASEMEADSDQMFIGLQARMITRMVRKLKQRLIRERKREHPCVVLFTNQMRIKIGVMFGSPETMPGGWGLQHEFSLMLRIVKKALSEGDKKKYVDAARNQERAVRHAFSVKKHKVLTLAGIGEFVRCKEALPELGLEKGKINDTNLVMNYAKEYGLVVKKGKAWDYMGHKAATLEKIKDLWKRKPTEYVHTQRMIIDAAKRRLIPDAE